MKLTAPQIINALAVATNGVVTFVGIMLASALVLCSGFALYDTLYIEQSAKQNWDTLQYRPDIIDDPNARLTPSELAAINPDYRAWITVYDTNIDYPVMQGGDDLYYASHDVYKETSLSGSIYLAAANSPDFSDNYNLLYGHHMDNGAMFGDLDKFMDADFFDAHRKAVLVTDDAVYDLYIFALVETDAYEQTIYNAGNKDLAELLAYVASHYLQYDTGVQIGEKVIALSTCASSATNGRLVLLATMTLRGGESVDPDTPVQPDSPDNPDSPGAPDNPDSPGAPDNPDNTGTPDNPDNPGTPGTSGTPGNAGTPDPEYVPGQASEPTAPSTPETKPENIPEGTPISLNIFEPRANEGGLDNWALLNLISMILTVWLFVPLGYLKDKFKRRRELKQIEKDLVEGTEKDGQTIEPLDEDIARELKELVKRVVRRFRVGLVLELLIAVASVVFFFYVTDFRQPMVIINRHTPPLLLMLAACWLVDLLLIRFCVRKKTDTEEADHE